MKLPGTRPITVAGSANLDLVLRVARLPGAGETVSGKGYAEAAGGKGANQAVAAARLGGNVAFCGRVGNDAAGRLLIRGLKREGIDVSDLRTDRATPTGRACILVDDAGRNQITVLPGANSRVRPSDVPARRLRKGILLLQLEIPLKTVAGILARTGSGVFVILNPAPAAGPLPANILRRVDLLVPNEHEAAVLTGVKDPVTAARRLLGRGARCVIVTLGGRGAVLVARDLVARVPAFRVRAVDTTAAGDTFCGALAQVLSAILDSKDGTSAEGRRRPGVVVYASAAAAISVTRPGAQPSIPDMADLWEFLDRRCPTGDSSEHLVSLLRKHDALARKLRDG